MPKYVPDNTGRFSQRPYYKSEELDYACENLIKTFLKDNYGTAKFPVSTDDLTRLIERDAKDLDLYADLSSYGAEVEGLTEFSIGHKPSVKISAKIAEDKRRENRLRTTLTHEYGHVHFHSYLWELEPPQPDLLLHNPHANKQICKRENILDAAQTDWMEWQAGYVCGALLMPASLVRKLVGDYLEAHDLYGMIGSNDSHGQALIDAVQSAFQVSANAACIRLFKLRFLSEASSGQSLFST